MSPSTAVASGRGGWRALSMIDRALRRRSFVAAHGWPNAVIEPLAGDASFRRYYRVTDRGRRLVLMDAPPEREAIEPFVAVAEHLRRWGFSAPRIFAADQAAGFVLLEDFGDDTFSRLLDRGEDAAALYTMAVDVLVHLQERSVVAAPTWLPAYDLQRLLDEAALFVDWYLPAVRYRPTTTEARDAFLDAWRRVLPEVVNGPTTLVLRDFHVDNLMRLAGRDGIAACGLLDFQDAVHGHPAYDLMSLLEDARRDLPSDLKATMLSRYLAAVDGGAAFERAFAVLAAQRHTKVIGIFTRLRQRDGKPAYLVHIPRVWRLLEAALANPALAPVRRWFDEHVPDAARCVPQ